MKVNKITKLYPDKGAPITEEIIQAHFDEMNADGWELITISNLDGWYRFYWVKEVV